MPAGDIVVVGGSAGSIEATTLLLGALTPGFPAPVLVVLHRSPFPSDGQLAAVLSRAGHLPVTEPIGRAPLRPGHVYLAAADHHLLIEPGVVRGVRGPHEQRHRPAIDPLFRSAAVAYGRSTIGVLLSGTGTDGTIGLWYVRDRGGTTIVQGDAAFREMPENAARFVEVQHVLPIDAIGPLLIQLMEGARPAARRNPRHGDEDES